MTTPSPAGETIAEASAGPRALIIDWVGVLTAAFEDAVASWAESEDFEAESFMAALAEVRGADLGDQAQGGMIREIECGNGDVRILERELATRLRRRCGTPLDGCGLLQRMFSHFCVDFEMLAAVRALRARGYRTALLSNSWGNHYPRELWRQVFDHALISGELGMRKPQREIYLYAAARLGVAPAEAVFVDDMADNVDGAVAAGMTGVLHESRTHTIRVLSEHFAVDLEMPTHVD